LPGWKIESLGISSNSFGSDFSDSNYGAGVKWRFAGQPMRVESPVEKAMKENEQEMFSNVGNPDGERIDFSTPSISEGMLTVMNIEQLKAVAAQLGISKVSRASKEELIKAILQKQG
jgi:hypothetical protein